ncbi:hypothetical protein M2360_001884 [Rhizobium sp. SG_E_25_P2]|jgi:hypothetical protein|nr:hypothetical protein [Rhizobium sp. SG_E_25_P2]MDH6266488.1 hypothetical protein [Rhizobium sp. SG_E_25_P2]
MAEFPRRRRAIAIAKAEKAETGARLFWIATLSASFATLYGISLFLS